MPENLAGVFDANPLASALLYEIHALPSTVRSGAVRLMPLTNDPLVCARYGVSALYQTFAIFA